LSSYGDHGREPGPSKGEGIQQGGYRMPAKKKAAKKAAKKKKH
jgi:hypothetical protein